MDERLLSCGEIWWGLRWVELLVSFLFCFFSKRGNYWREPRWHWVGTDYLCMLWYFQFGLRAKIKSRLRKLRLTIIGWFSIIATLVKAWVARWVKTAMSKVRILLVVPLARKIRILMLWCSDLHVMWKQEKLPFKFHILYKNSLTILIFYPKQFSHIPIFSNCTTNCLTIVLVIALQTDC